MRPTTVVDILAAASWLQLPVHAATTWTSLPWLARLEQPTLVIGGAADSLIPTANACLLSTCLPNARSHVVESGGHLCRLDRAAEIGPVIERFFT